jgi:pimeloyl-ACP methyl ester carboxylesterase
MDVLEIPAATLCGHSFGGAIAMFFGTRYSERVERVVLVSAGGLGREVHPVLRAAALRVAPRVLRVAMSPRMRRFYARPGLHRALRLTPENVINLRRAGRALGTEQGQAFFAALRGVIAPSGQRVASSEMRTFAERVPMLLIWSEDDPVIPLAHAQAHLERAKPYSRLVIFPSRGHEPHRRNAERFAVEVADFVLTSH